LFDTPNPLGTSISVFGTLGANNTNEAAVESQYQLDGNKPSVYLPVLTAGAQRNQRFYQSPELSKAQHTIVVTNLINGSNLLILDYFIVVTGNTAHLSSTSPVPTAVPDAPNGMGGTSVIAGSVGGVTAFLLLLFVIIYFWKRRKKKAVEDDLSSNIGQSGKYFLFLFYLD
jgi:hypothetical protein